MIRGIGLRGATALNVITMIGIGPLITIPLVLADLHGATALAAWVAGAVIALCDGLAWAELGSLFPGSGGTYVFVREAFGSARAGRMLAFLFAWQILLSGPLVLASGYIGFAHYAGYLWAPLAGDLRLQGIVAAGVGVLTLVLLYRRIHTIGAMGIGLAGVAVVTLCAVIAAAAGHFSAAQALGTDPHTGIGPMLAAGLGPALVITLYDYYGYGQSCTISDEVQRPARVLPASVVLAIAVVAVLYVALQFGVLGVVRWQELVPAGSGAIPDAANYVASTVVERTWGLWPARIVTLLILVTAFASTFGNLLGYSRIPYAAAADGVFLRPFAALHPRGHFPHVALVTMGLLALPACFLSLGDVINALTAGLVLVQSIAQLVAVALLRRRGVRAPYRMLLYPFPVIVALAGWLYIFWSSGTKAIAFGLLSLGTGCAVFLWQARRQAAWPFAKPVLPAGLVLIAFAALALAPREASAAPARRLPTWGHAAIAERDGGPVFEVDGAPFFVYGAAFFYERMPRDRWDGSMRALRALGINTLDLYVPWNWHELSDGDFDFTGRTNPRRDLRTVLRLARLHGFKIVLRPGPVIRNEWRNAGYPAWLLKRPEYGMPLHDLLEGRYPPTATLQNAHSDDAAAQWLRNATHRLYARRWLVRVLRECAPDADRILAVALDDDQGAYLNNQTWPAPHLRAYLGWLRDVVTSVTGPREETFINTYQMKVPASSPVWTMGNWYQSDTFALGEHDVAQLGFSTALLQTRPDQPLFASEFQAGWLEAAGDIRPRAADPRNTSLALAEMVGLGVRGVVNFPAQDTLYPGGWEVPFANAFYAWDAALTLQGTPSARYVPTAQLGAFVRRFGSRLAAAHVAYDAAIVYLGESIARTRSDNAWFAGVADQTIAAQTACRQAGLACALVDPVALSPQALARFRLLIVPLGGANRAPLDPVARRRLAAFRRGGGAILEGVPPPGALLRALRAQGRRPIVRGVPGGATFAWDAAPRRGGFLCATNDGWDDLTIEGASVTLAEGRRVALPRFVVAAHAGIVAALDVAGARVRLTSTGDMPVPRGWRERTGLPVREDAFLAGGAPFAPVSSRALAYRSDAYRDGDDDVVFDNGLVRLVVAPAAGARAFLFEDDATGRNVFTTVGALRDDVALEPPPSASDYIAKYTHDFPAGTFNRPYAAAILASGGRAVAEFRYDAPDVLPSGGRFERTVTLERAARSFTVDERATFHSGPGADEQRAVQVSSLAVGHGSAATLTVLAPAPVSFAENATETVDAGDALGLYDARSGDLATVAWRAGDVAAAQVLERRDSLVVRLTLAPARLAHVRYEYLTVPSLAAAQRALAAADAAAQISTQGSGPAGRTGTLAGKWRNGLRDRLKSD